MASSLSVLRIGPSSDYNGYADKLRSALVSHFAGAVSDARPNAADTLTVSNRYFDAPVLLAPLHLSADTLAGQIGPSKSACHLHEDGIILVFDASPTSSSCSSAAAFDALGPIHASAEETDRAGDLLRLCIGSSVRPPGPPPDGDAQTRKEYEMEYSRRVLWCLDRGYEYLEVDFSSDGLRRGMDDRDKEGFARVVEAISCCMWSSHVMKDRNGNVHGNGRKEPAAREGTETTASPVNDAERESAARAALLRDVPDPSSRTDPKTNQDDHIASQQRKQTQRMKQQEAAFHELEHVLEEAKRIRAASALCHENRDNGNGTEKGAAIMSDEERRRKAGDTAMKLMDILDRLGMDDDEDGDSFGDDDSASSGIVLTDQ
ncbi:hypothetical protein ACHAXS_005640 [Conticribra weissflogii]